VFLGNKESHLESTFCSTFSDPHRLTFSIRGLGDSDLGSLDHPLLAVTESDMQLARLPLVQAPGLRLVIPRLEVVHDVLDVGQTGLETLLDLIALLLTSHAFLDALAKAMDPARLLDHGRAYIVGDGSVCRDSLVSVLVIVNGSRSLCRSDLAGILVIVNGASLISLILFGDDMVISSENDLATGGHSDDSEACLVAGRLVIRDVLFSGYTLIVWIVLIVEVMFSV
jgi:hypothetical protein